MTLLEQKGENFQHIMNSKKRQEMADCLELEEEGTENLNET